jgi:hypothetical protein
MTPVTAKNLTLPPEDAPAELIEVYATTFRALANAEFDAKQAAASRAKANTAVTQYENLLMEHQGQGTLI